MLDALLVGGAMANTFLAALGKDMRNSLVEKDKLALARTIVETARDRGVALVLPVDAIVAKSTDSTAGEQCDVGALPEGTMMLDIGPQTVGMFSKHIAAAKTVFWNGPMGLFEKAPFAAGTFGVARALAASPAFTVVGGGDSAAAVHAAGEDIARGMKHISTGGGASLELIEGKKLPGIEVLRGEP